MNARAKTQWDLHFANTFSAKTRRIDHFFDNSPPAWVCRKDRAQGFGGGDQHVELLVEEFIFSSILSCKKSETKDGVKAC